MKIYKVILLSLSSLGCSFDAMGNNGGSGPQSPLNCSYNIEAEEIALTNGRYSKEIVPNSATKTSVMVLGEPVYGDLDQDGIEDAAVLLVYQSGGSGTFYYVAAALKKAGTFQGSNAVLLGDRIADPGIVISNGQLSAHYKIRLANEPMSAVPSITTSKILVINNRRLKVIKPQMSESDKQDRIALDLGRKVLAVKTAIQNPDAADAMQAITNLGLDQRYYVMLRGWLLMQLQADQSIAEANKPDVPEAVQERIDFIKSAIRRIDLE